MRKIYGGHLLVACYGEKHGWVINGEYQVKFSDDGLRATVSDPHHRSRNYAEYMCDVPDNLQGDYNFVLNTVDRLRKEILEERVGVDIDGQIILWDRTNCKMGWKHTPWEKLTPEQRTKAIEVYVNDKLSKG